MNLRKLNKMAVIMTALVLAAVLSLIVLFYIPGFGRAKAAAANPNADISVDGSEFGRAQIEQSAPIELPAAAQYPKPMFDGTVVQVDPAWSAPSVVPAGSAHIDPDHPQSLPVQDFTITQCWEGKIRGSEFILQTYCDFDLSKGGQSGGGACYLAWKTGGKVYVTPVDKFETLVNFCGPMAVFIRNSMSYDVLAINLQSGNEVEASGDEMYSLACAQPFDPSHPPAIPTRVMGISQQVDVYPVSQMSASVSNPFNDPKNPTLWMEAWEHRIGGK